MKNQPFLWQRLTYGLAFLSLLIYGLVMARTFFVPLVFAILLALILTSLVRFFERKVRHSITAIALTYLVVLLPVSGLLFSFSWFSVDIFQEIPSIKQEIDRGLRQSLAWINEQTGITIVNEEGWIKENISRISSNILNFLSRSVSSTTASIASIFLTLVYTALFLYYRGSFYSFVVMQFPRERQDSVRAVIQRLQKVLQRYCYGMLFVIGILAILNSVGLWLIGIEYAPFWGCMAAFLAIIPYIGTTLGGFLPFVYALATTGTFWQPAAVIGYYFLIQQVEGNLITPNVVGNQVSINPLIVILGMFAGGLIWGISGLIIALPLLAMLRVFFEETAVLQPVAVLLSSDIRQKKNRLDTDLNQDKHRLFF